MIDAGIGIRIKTPHTNVAAVKSELRLVLAQMAKVARRD
jgi:hypothetical protein